MTADEIYRHLINADIWVKTLVGYSRISTVKVLTAKELARVHFPIKYKCFPAIMGEITHQSVFSDPDAKYWRSAEFVIYRHNPNELKD